MYHTFNVPIRAIVKYYYFDEEKYAPYRLLYAQNEHQLGEWNKLMTMLSLRRDYERAAWIKDAEYELDDYKQFNSTGLVQTKEAYDWLENKIGRSG